MDVWIVHYQDEVRSAFSTRALAEQYLDFLQYGNITRFEVDEVSQYLADGLKPYIVVVTGDRIHVERRDQFREGEMIIDADRRSIKVIAHSAEEAYEKAITRGGLES